MFSRHFVAATMRVLYVRIILGIISLAYPLVNRVGERSSFLD